MCNEQGGCGTLVGSSSPLRDKLNAIHAQAYNFGRRLVYIQNVAHGSLMWALDDNGQLIQYLSIIQVKLQNDDLFRETVAFPCIDNSGNEVWVTRVRMIPGDCSEHGYNAKEIFANYYVSSIFGLGDVEARQTQNGMSGSGDVEVRQTQNNGLDVNTLAELWQRAYDEANSDSGVSCEEANQVN